MTIKQQKTVTVSLFPSGPAQKGRGVVLMAEGRVISRINGLSLTFPAAVFGRRENDLSHFVLHFHNV